MNDEDLNVEGRDSHNLTPRQRTLFEAIQSKNESLSAMFVGAVFVLNDKENPDRFALAAHGFRELLEKISRYFNLPQLTAGPPLQIKVGELQKHWENVCCDSQYRDVFDGKLQEFFVYYKQSTPKRRDSIKSMLGNFDPMKELLPMPIAELRAEKFDKIWKYFERIAHHKSFHRGEFEEWQNTMEEFLLDTIMPRTFDDFTNIDAIIFEGESNDYV